jgi:hypothetical protein
MFEEITDLVWFERDAEFKKCFESSKVDLFKFSFLQIMLSFNNSPKYSLQAFRKLTTMKNIKTNPIAKLQFLRSDTETSST